MKLEKHKDFFRKHKTVVAKHSHTGWRWAQEHLETILWASLSIGVLLLGIILIWFATLKVPTLDNFTERQVSSSTKIYDKTGLVVLYDVHENIKRTVVLGEQIPQTLKNAVIAIEDRDFYRHKGIQPRAIVRAVLSQIIPGFSGPSQGGSTITQQLIKNVLLTQEKSISRKVKEWVLAIKLERIMSKDDILTAYLNEAPYGGEMYGVQEAAQTFFGKDISEVNLAESAYLAAIPNAPSYYSPYGKNRPNLNARKNLVLKNMLEQGYITEDEYQEARSAQVTFRPREEGNGKALHFIHYIRDYLEEKYGESVVASGGLKVITTLDWELQQVAEKTIKENSLKNKELYNASNSALVALDPKTGQILSMVGSRDYFDKTIDGMFNVATAGRQPGSSFKPIVYARGFEKGFNPETVLFDVPTQFGTSAQCPPLSTNSTPPCYAPQNYDGAHVGPISLRNALAQSRNIPAVKMLWLVGINDALNTAKKLGITTLDRTSDRYGLTLVLGGGEVSLLDITSVYGVFANDGVRNTPTGILSVADATGKILEEYTPRPEPVLDYNAARKLSSVLSDNVARAPLFGSNSFFYFGSRDVAGKTGTTNDNKDAWVIGYAPNIAVGVWTGNNDNTPMKKGSAISGPAWRAFMDAALAKLPNESFASPELDPDYYTKPPVFRGGWAGGESFFVDTVSGKLATALTPPETKKEYVIPNPRSILYWLNPNNPSSDSQYSRWEAAVQNWIAKNPNSVPGAPSKPIGFDDVHTLANQPVVTITEPFAEVPYGRDLSLQVTISAVLKYPLRKIDYYLNDNFIGSSTGTSFSFIPSDNNAFVGQNTLRVIVTDEVYNRGEYSMTIELQ